jgi:hypothetical protein
MWKPCTVPYSLTVSPSLDVPQTVVLYAKEINGQRLRMHSKHNVLLSRKYKFENKNFYSTKINYRVFSWKKKFHQVYILTQTPQTVHNNYYCRLMRF